MPLLPLSAATCGPVHQPSPPPEERQLQVPDRVELGSFEESLGASPPVGHSASRIPFEPSHDPRPQFAPGLLGGESDLAHRRARPTRPVDGGVPVRVHRPPGRVRQGLVDPRMRVPVAVGGEPRPEDPRARMPLKDERLLHVRARGVGGGSGPAGERSSADGRNRVPFRAVTGPSDRLVPSPVTRRRGSPVFRVDPSDLESRPS